MTQTEKRLFELELTVKDQDRRIVALVVAIDKLVAIIEVLNTRTSR